MSFCPACGSQNPENANVCSNCGKVLKTAPQQQTTPAQSTYPTPAPTLPGKGLGIAGMVVGIVALVCFCFWPFALICSIVGTILSAISSSKAKQVGAKNGMATAGIACSVIALGLIILIIVLAAAGAIASTNMWY